MSAQPSTSPPLRRFPRWLKITLLAILVVVGPALAAVWWRIRTAETAFRDNATILTDVVDELDALPAVADEPVYFLLIGSDSREGVDVDQFEAFEGARGDVVMVARLDPVEARVTILSIPRDTWVPIDGHGEGMVNAAYDVGGAELMVETVQKAFELPIHHYVEIGFVGFQDLVDEIDGVEVDFEYPARDLRTHLDVPAGTILLDGDQALAYARSRHYTELRGGEWRGVRTNEIGRIQRQQELVKAILRRLRRPSTLSEAGSIVSSFAQHVTVDATLADASLISLAFAMRGVVGEVPRVAILPTHGRTRGDSRVRLLEQPAADEMLAAFRSGRPMDDSDSTASLAR